MPDTTILPNTPGIPVDLLDNGLSIALPADTPRVLVLGTASQGQSNSIYLTNRVSTAASHFGSSGTLTRGLYEVTSAGVESPLLYRMGATAAKVEYIGDTTQTGGYTIETVRADDDAGEKYSAYYDDATDRLVVWDVDAGTMVFDNANDIDTGTVIVSGSRGASGGTDFGSASSGTLLEDISGTASEVVYTAGTDGATPSRMELFEYLCKAYAELLGQDFDFVFPVDIYHDDKNIIDGDAFGSAYLASISSGGTYPTAASSDDILGKVFVEEYQGNFYFFWNLNTSTPAVAHLYPDGIGYADSTHKISGEEFTSSDFHEVNFSYQLARFCHEVSSNGVECLGFIGTRPPASLSRADLAAWIGELPTYTRDSLGELYVTSAANDGTGLLGNKFMAGKYGYRSGISYGGMILTDGDFIDGTEQTDANGNPIELGRYISVCASYVRIFNPFDTTGWGYPGVTTGLYAGYVATLNEKNSPINQVLPGASHLIPIRARVLDKLIQAGYVVTMKKPKGLVVLDSPTAARPTSDFYALTTMRIVKKVIDVFRAKVDPFIGKSVSGLTRTALETAIDQGLKGLMQAGYITSYDFTLKQTPRQRVIGDMYCELEVAPAWALRRVILTLGLRAE
jgi:hypothetical protein